MKKRHILYWCSCLLALWSSLPAQSPLEFVNISAYNEYRINSPELEYSPAFFQDGIVYTSTSLAAKQVIDDRIKKHTMSLFIAKRDDTGFLKEAKEFAPEIQTRFHDGPVCFTVTGDMIFFTSNSIRKGKKQPGKGNITHLKIYSSTQKDGKWADPEELPFNDSESDACHPSMDAGGQILYFASNRSGGFGGLDIYMVRKDSSGWGTPVNLGPMVNSGGDDMFPFIHPDGTLYFASNGHGGKGAIDIVYTTQVNDEWQKPKALPEPFNSSFDDFGLIIDVDNRNGYFSSNRIKGSGGDDIYSFAVQKDWFNDKLKSKKSRPFEIALKSDDSTSLEDAEIKILNLEELQMGDILRTTDENGNPVALQYIEDGDNDLFLKMMMDSSQITGKPDADGKFKTKLYNSQYAVQVTKPGFKPYTIFISPNDTTLTNLNITLKKATPCAKVNGIVYDGDMNRPKAGLLLTVTNTTNGEVESTVTDKKGKFTLCLDCGKTYVISTTVDGQVFEKTITTEADCDKSMEALILPFNTGAKSGDKKGGRGFLAEGQVIHLPNIYFNFNDAGVRPEGQADLEALAIILREFPEVSIDLPSFTDCRGSFQYNLRLSKKRSDAVTDYLVSKGVDRNRIRPMGLGELGLRNQCKDGVKCSDREHQLNRRTEVRITTSTPVGVVMDDRALMEDGKSAPADGNPPMVKEESEGQEAPKSIEEIQNKFAVIAGTFSIKENAERQKQKLSKLGYDGIEIIISETSGFHAVKIGGFGERNKAENIVQDLYSRFKIQAYVKTF